MLNLNEIVIELTSRKQKAVLNDLFDEGRYYCYWLIKAFEILKDNSFSHYYEYEKLEFNAFFEYFSLELIIYEMNKENIQQRTKFLEQLLSLINNKTEIQYFNEDSQNYIETMFISWQDKNFTLENVYNSMSQIKQNLVTYISKNQLIDINYTVFILYKLSLLEYAKSLVYFLLPSEKFNCFDEIKKCVIKGLKYYPINYLLFDILSKISNEDKEILKYNWIWSGINFASELSYINEGNYYNAQKQFEKANNIFLIGLSLSMPGSHSLFFYSIAKNIHDLIYENQIINEEKIYISIDNAIKAIYYTIIEIDNFGICVFPQKILNKENVIYIILNSYNIIGLNKYYLNDLSGAIETFTKIINKIILSSRLAQYIDHFIKEVGNLFVNRGRTYLKLKKYTDALRDFYDSLVYLPENFLSPYFYISECYEYLEDYNYMINILLRAETLNVSAKMKCEIYGRLIYAYAKKNDMKNVEKYSNKYIDQINDNMTFYSDIGSIYLMNKKYKRAKYYLDIACNGDNPNAFYYYSIYYQKSNKNSKAKRYFKDYIKLSMNDLEKEYKESYSTDNNLSCFLYKYRPINKNTVEMLINDYLYFADINKLNDPFDCRLIYEYSSNDAFREAFNEVGYPKIMSLSASKFQNELLWSHYSNNHYGLCIGYEINIMEALKKDIYLFEVKYVDEIMGTQKELFENIRIIKNIRNIWDGKKYSFIEENTRENRLRTSLIISMIDKKNSWKYEKEYRLINFKYNKIFNDRIYKIKNIIFGCNAQDNDIKTIICIYKLKGKNYDIIGNKIVGDSVDIEFKKMKRSDNNLFSLDEDEMFDIKNYL